MAAESNTTPMPIKSRSGFISTIKLILGDPMGAIGLTLVLAFFVVSIFASQLAPMNPNKIDVRAKLQAPSAMHLLGTDQLGRDNLSRVVHGSQIALKVSMISIVLAVLIGTAMGLVAGYSSKLVDSIFLLFFDTIRSYPTIMFALAVVALFGPSLNTIIGIVVVTSIPTYGRIVRTLTLSLRNAEYVEAERAMGSSVLRILTLHILPNVIGPVLIVASMEVPLVITLEAGLSYLGLGVRPPTPSWGSILFDGYSFFRNTPWIMIAAGTPLILATIGFTFLGETLRDKLDPKLRK